MMRDGSSLQCSLSAHSFSDDISATQRAAAALIGYYARAKSEYIHLHPSDIGEKVIGHFGFFRCQFKDTLWQETLNWLNQQ
jgi:predicted alpha/beta hydrolase